MATKYLNIPPLQINLIFLEDLGRIIENEVKKRKKIGKEKANAEFLEEEKEINARTFYKNKEEKNKSLESAKKRIFSLNRPHYSLVYYFDLKNGGTEEFSSIDEVLENKNHLKETEAVRVRLSQYSDEYVDVDMDLVSPMSIFFALQPRKISIYSKNRPRLLEMEDSLSALLKNQVSIYQKFFYPHPLIGQAVPFLISIGVVLSISILLLNILHVDYLKENLPAIVNLLVWMLVILYPVVMGFIKWIYPYFDFQILSNQYRGIIRLGMGVLITGSLLSLLSYIFELLFQFA